MIWARDGGGCPTCRGWGLLASGRCQSCGSSTGSSRISLPPWLGRRFDSWIRRHELHEIALVLALVPLILPLPLISITMCALAARGMPWRDHLWRWSLTLSAAVLNIILSAWALSEISTGLVALLLEWWSSTWELIPRPASQSQSSLGTPV